jgi:hypothetical protein
MYAKFAYNILLEALDPISHAHQRQALALDHARNEKKDKGKIHLKVKETKRRFGFSSMHGRRVNKPGKNIYTTNYEKHHFLKMPYYTFDDKS